MDSKALYWGDNGVQEFWETEDHEWLILRVHSETGWSAHHKCQYVCSGMRPEDVARKLPVKLTFVTDRDWVRDRNDNFILELISSNCGLSPDTRIHE
jgi:hypothetical protein